MAYAKVFNTILSSSVWAEPDSTRIVWLTMLIMANRDGLVEATVPGIAYMARVSIDVCETAIATLSSPDRHSRTKVDDGRRVRQVEGGWLVVNYEAYSDKSSAEEKAEAARLRQERKRERDAAKNGVTPCHANSVTGHASSHEERDESRDVTHVTPHLDSASLNATQRSSPEVPDTSSAPRPDGLGAFKQAAKAQRDAQIEAWFEEFWAAFNYRKDRKRALKEFRRIKDLDAIMPKILSSAAAYSAAHPGNVYQKHPSTWLNGECWNDDIDKPHQAAGIKPRIVPDLRPEDYTLTNGKNVCSIDEWMSSRP